LTVRIGDPLHYGYSRSPRFLGKADPVRRTKAQRGPLCAVGNGVGKRSRETGMVPGGSGGSLSLTGRACQRKTRLGGDQEQEWVGDPALLAFPPAAPS
jgi:hypothetical protein